MARIAGVDLPPQKRAEIGLTYIFGIGRARANSLLARASVSPDKKIRDLTEEEVNTIRHILEEEGAVETRRYRRQGARLLPASPPVIVWRRGSVRSASARSLP